MNSKYQCPNCWSSEFITDLNQYDVLEFSKDGFETISTENIDEYKIFCRDCGKEVDVKKSDKKIILRKT